MNRAPPSEQGIPIGAATRAGQGRKANEDSLWVPEGVSQAGVARKGYLYIVADGIGGHQKGDVASQTAVEIIRRAYYEDQSSDVAASLQRAVEAANSEIFRRGQDPAHTGLGSTVVAGVVHGNQLVIANVGDSRAYLLRKRKLKRLTTDHTWVAERVAAGILTAEEAAHHDMRHVVTRSLGSKPTVQVDVRRFRLRPGDRLLLCSDGVWEPISEQQMMRTVTQKPPQAAAASLVEGAAAAGGKDDATALVVAPEVTQAGVLDRSGRAAKDRLSSPLRRGVVIGTLAVLLLVFSTFGIIRLFRGWTVRPKPMPTRAYPQAEATLVSDNAEGQTAEAPQSNTPAGTGGPTPTPSPFGTGSTPEVKSPTTPVQGPTQTGARYCIVPSTNTDVSPDYPANAVDPDTCETTGTSIPVGERVWIANSAVSQECGPDLIIEVMHDEQRYWILANRIWRQTDTGECQPFEDWRRFFATPRQP